MRVHNLLQSEDNDKAANPEDWTSNENVGDESVIPGHMSNLKKEKITFQSYGWCFSKKIDERIESKGHQ